MCIIWPRKLGASGPWPLAFDATHRIGGGAAEDADVGVIELDGQGGLGDEHGHGLAGEASSEGDLMADSVPRNTVHQAQAVSCLAEARQS